LVAVVALALQKRFPIDHQVFEPLDLDFGHEFGRFHYLSKKFEHFELFAGENILPYVPILHRGRIIGFWDNWGLSHRQ